MDVVASGEGGRGRNWFGRNGQRDSSLICKSENMFMSYPVYLEFDINNMAFPEFSKQRAFCRFGLGVAWRSPCGQSCAVIQGQILGA